VRCFPGERDHGALERSPGRQRNGPGERAGWNRPVFTPHVDQAGTALDSVFEIRLISRRFAARTSLRSTARSSRSWKPPVSGCGACFPVVAARHRRCGGSGSTSTSPTASVPSPFGLLCLVIATHDFKLVEQIDAIQPLTIAVSAAYLAVCLRFFFYGPTILISPPR
jgi:hypothetical protein